MAIAAVLKTAVRKDFWVRIPGPPLHTAPQQAAPASTSGSLTRVRACVIRTATAHDAASDTRLCLAPPRRIRDISRSLGTVCRREGDVAERLKATVC